MRHYEINVSLNGKHLFATAPRSLTDHEKAKALFRDFEKRFPESEGYELHATYCPGERKVVTSILRYE